MISDGGASLSGDPSSKIAVYGWSVRSRRYQLPGFPPRSAGSAGPARTNPALVSTFRDAGFA